MPSIVKYRKWTFVNDGTVSDPPSTIPDDYNYQHTASVHVIETSDLARTYFLIRTPEEGQCLRLKIVKALCSHRYDLNSNASLKEFVFTFKDDTIAEIMSFNEIIHHIQNQDYQYHIGWSFKRVTSHKGLLSHVHPS